jgi:hypothetical protein
VQSGKIREDLFGESFYSLPLSEQGLLDALLVQPSGVDQRAAVTRKVAP